VNDEFELVRRLAQDGDTAPAAVSETRRELMELIHDEQTRAANAAPPGRQIVPYLIYEDVAGAVDWLEKAFGFRELIEARLVDPDGILEHAEVEAEGSLLILGPPSIHGDSPRRGVSTMLTVRVLDVDSHHYRSRAAGAEIVIDLGDAPWGVRRYQARDPEGHQWHFEQPLERSSA